MRKAMGREAEPAGPSSRRGARTGRTAVLLTFCCISAFSASAGAKTYYVDASSGSDSNTGISNTSPWKTVAKVNGKSFLPGDSILFKRGETWREQLTVSSSGTSGHPITFGAYGAGPKPIISGADSVTRWNLYSGNIYVADVPTRSAPPTQLYVDEAFYDIAHYPNTGYLLTTADAATATSLIDAKLTLSADQVVGATVSTRAARWRINTPSATAYDATTHTISLSGPTYSSSYGMKARYGYFLSNKFWMLDAPGEWYYDTTAGKLYLWAADGSAATDHTVEVSNRSYGVSCVGKRFITVQDLEVTKADQKTVYIYDSSDVTAQRLDISGGMMGVNVSASSNILINENRVDSSISAGMYLVVNSGKNYVISGNLVNNAGNVGAMPKQSFAGIFADGVGLTIKNNSVTNSGYNGIEFHGDRDVVQNNVVDRSCLVLDDGAGIYTVPYGYTQTVNTISGNVVTNSLGNPGGSPDPGTHAHGIYLDDKSHDITVSGNSVSNADLGIFVHSGYNDRVTGNKVYAARNYAFLLEEDSYPVGSVHNNLVTRNHFESSAATPPVYYLSTIQGSTANFGTYDANLFCHPNSKYVVQNQRTNYTLAGWQAASAQDLSSREVNGPCVAPPPTLKLSAGSAVNGSAVLSWQSTSAMSCLASGAWSGVTPATGRWSVRHSGNYGLTCTGRGGTVSDDVTVVIY